MQQANHGWLQPGHRAPRAIFVLGTTVLLGSFGSGLLYGFSTTGGPPYGGSYTLHMAKVYAAAGDYHAAAAEFRGAQRVGAIDPVVSLQLAASLRRLGRPDEAIEALGVGADSTFNSQIHIRYAVALADRGRRDEARRALQRAARANPDSAFVWVQLGNFSASGREFGRAAEAFEQALKIDPGLQTALDGLDVARAGKLSGSSP